MNYREAKEKVLALIEELNLNEATMTSDPDIAAKLPHVMTQVMFELCRFKKIPKYAETQVKAGQVMEFLDFESVVGYEVYQIEKISGVKYQSKADGTVIKFTEDGLAEIEAYVYPERITSSTPDTYEFDLSADVMEILPYGVAADLLKSDISTNYGKVYADRYREMMERLDSRYTMPSISIDGGVMF